MDDGEACPRRCTRLVSARCLRIPSSASLKVWLRLACPTPRAHAPEFPTIAVRQQAPDRSPVAPCLATHGFVSAILANRYRGATLGHACTITQVQVQVQVQAGQRCLYAVLRF